ncbi:MAG: SH3 domain-containing protein [Anaerolineae bacterium]
MHTTKRLVLLLFMMAMLSLTVSVYAQTNPTPTPDPTANILWPPPVYVLRDSFTVYGSVSLPNMTSWFIEFRPYTTDPNVRADEGWLPVTLPSRTPVQNSVLGVWDTTLAEDGIYSLRLNITISGNSRRFHTVEPIRIENEAPLFGAPAVPTLAALPTLLPTPTAFSTTPQATSKVDANVRSGDGTNFPIVSKLPTGTTVPIIGISSLGTGWYLIVLPSGGQGWVAPSVVDVTGNFALVPRVNPPPPPVTPTPIPTATPASSINLVAGNFRFDPGSPNCAQTFNIYLDVANFGTAASPGGFITIQDFRRADGVQQGNTVGAFPIINPGQTVNVGPIPLTISTYYNEEHRLLMVVDGNNAIFESNESDNAREAIYVLNKASCP